MFSSSFSFFHHHSHLFIIVIPLSSNFHRSAFSIAMAIKKLINIKSDLTRCVRLKTISPTTTTTRYCDTHWIAFGTFCITLKPAGYASVKFTCFWNRKLLNILKKNAQGTKIIVRFKFNNFLGGLSKLIDQWDSDW